ncbi:MAG: hypothetical protein P8185_25790 [Deltaproteobacteria bacterium]
MYQINRSSIPKAIDELLAKGFLSMVHHGGRGVGDRNIYELSENYQDWTPEKKETQNKKTESEVDSSADLERHVQDSENATPPPNSGGVKSTLKQAFGSIF